MSLPGFSLSLHVTYRSHYDNQQRFHHFCLQGTFRILKCPMYSEKIKLVRVVLVIYYIRRSAPKISCAPQVWVFWLHNASHQMILKHDVWRRLESLCIYIVAFGRFARYLERVFTFVFKIVSVNNIGWLKVCLKKIWSHCL